MRPETLAGALLVAIGAALLLIGLAPRFIKTVAELHPLIYTQISLDGLKIGTSPLLIIILASLYILLLIRSPAQ
jgi:hypothetical protein